MKVMNANEMRAINGGATYYSCKHCGKSWKGVWPFRWLAQMQRDSHQRLCMKQF